MAGFGDQQVVLDADAAEVAVFLHHIVVDEIGELVLFLPDVDQMRDEIDARLNGDHEARFQLAGHTQRCPSEDVARTHSIVIANVNLSQTFHVVHIETDLVTQTVHHEQRMSTQLHSLFHVAFHQA